MLLMVFAHAYVVVTLGIEVAAIAIQLAVLKEGFVNVSVDRHASANAIAFFGALLEHAVKASVYCVIFFDLIVVQLFRIES